MALAVYLLFIESKEVLVTETFSRGVLQVYARDVGEQLSALEGVLKDEQMQWLKRMSHIHK